MYGPFVLKQGDMVFFKNERMRELDDDIGDIQADMTDTQVKQQCLQQKHGTQMNCPTNLAKNL